MAALKISQAKARWYKKRAEEAERTLELQRNHWEGEWSDGWIHIQTLKIDGASFARLATARLLKHAVCVQVGSDTIRFYADKTVRENAK